MSDASTSDRHPLPSQGVYSVTHSGLVPEFRSCVTVNVDVLGSPSLIVLMVTVDVKYRERSLVWWLWSHKICICINLLIFLYIFCLLVFWGFFCWCILYLFCSSLCACFLYSTLCLRSGMGSCTTEMSRIILLVEEVLLIQCHQLTAACTQVHVSKNHKHFTLRLQTWNHDWKPTRTCTDHASQAHKNLPPRRYAYRTLPDLQNNYRLQMSQALNTPITTTIIIILKWRATPRLR